ncbi:MULTISPECIES: ABC-three component system protein [Micromonospora]|uniref:ABC-three component system protein n=1 Tax=Micromonospora TaxID=1873 RepID=UPI002FEFC928
MTANPFEATASALGYAYQFCYSLARALELFKEGPDWQVAIESADDVEELVASGRDLTQLKQRAPGTRLTDASVDLWKTLRIWSKGIRAGAFDPATTRLFLVTTAEVADGSAASFLLSGHSRDTQRALSLLRATAEKSRNETNLKAYSDFTLLTPEEGLTLCGLIEVVPDSPNIFDIKKKIEETAALVVRRNHVKGFTERLHGWWFERCLDVLGRPGTMILGADFDEFYNRLRDGFRPDQLHIDPDILDLDAEVTDFEDRVFVRQLELARIHSRRIALAIREYLRASTQRSRWVRDQAMVVGELNAYDRRMHGEWEIHFLRMLDDLGDACSDEEKISAARALYAWVETGMHPAVRLGCNEPFVARGTLHHLADQKHVGWHPDFEQLIEVARRAATE